MQMCNVCRQEEPKYRCPACKIRSCSLGCYKRHKDSCRPVVQTPTAAPEGRGDPLTTEPFEDLQHEDAIIDEVPREKLQRLGESEALRDLLCNPHLRRLLRSLDSAGNKGHAMKTSMQEPLFVEFADQCLRIVENNALTSHDHDDDDDEL